MAKQRWGWVAAGLGAVGVIGAGAYYLFERSSEQPDFTLIEQDGAFELRDYPELLVAQAVDTGPRLKALNRGFDKLADYIFAKSRRGERIAMTAPVLSNRESEGWRTRFIMPAKYGALTLPPPGPGVTLATRAARRVAVVRFSGMATDAQLEDREAALRRWMVTRGLAPGGVEHGFYNSPFVLGPLRRNEVMIAVVT